MNDKVTSQQLELRTSVEVNPILTLLKMTESPAKSAFIVHRLSFIL